MRHAVAAQPESPVESISRADRFASGVQDLEIGSAREPAFETSRDVMSAGLHLRPARQGQPRLGSGREAARDCREVARRKGGQQSVWSGLFKHGNEHSRGDAGRTSTIRSISRPSEDRFARPPRNVKPLFRCPLGGACGGRIASRWNAPRHPPRSSPPRRSDRSRRPRRW